MISDKIGTIFKEVRKIVFFYVLWADLISRLVYKTILDKCKKVIDIKYLLRIKSIVSDILPGFFSKIPRCTEY